MYLCRCHLAAVVAMAIPIGLGAFIVPPNVCRRLKVLTVNTPNIDHQRESFVTIWPRRETAIQHATAMVTDQQVELSNGVSMQLMASFPRKSSDKPVLLFCHGSFHGAWCWAEHFLPYFAELGYTSIALSWRGTGGTFAGEDVKKVKLLEHVDDLRCLLSKTLPEFIDQSQMSIKNTNPVLICHSFGGLAVMKYLELYGDKAPNVRGVVTMCSVPPSGNGKVTLRYLRRSLIASWKITAGFALKKCLASSELCRTLFFGGPKLARNDGLVDNHGISDEDVDRYRGYFARDSKATIDIMDLSQHLPSKAVDSDGQALFLDKVDEMPFLVTGAKDDFIVDREALEETTVFFGLDVNCGMPVLVDSPHDVMLGANWTNAAQMLNNWLVSSFNTAGL